MNGDGYTDLAFGAQGYPNGSYKGRTYVIFGGLGVGSNGDILLSSLNGSTVLNWMGKIIMIIAALISLEPETSMVIL